MTQAPTPIRHAPATDTVSALNQLNATFRSIKHVLQEINTNIALTLSQKEETNDVY
jgi:hypothetical protein